MLFIILGLLLYSFIYLMIYYYYGFIISNTIMIIIKTLYYYYGESSYYVCKDIFSDTIIEDCINDMETIDEKMKLQIISYSFNMIQKYIFPIIINNQNSSEKIYKPENNHKPVMKYNSKIFETKADEIAFLDKLTNNIDN